MYCVNCGTKVKGFKFCPSCGTKIEEKMSLWDPNLQTYEFKAEMSGAEIIDHEEQRETLKEILSKNIEEYCDRYRGRKEKMEAEKYVKKTNVSSKYRLAFIGVPMIIFTVLTMSPLGLLIGGIIGLFIYVFMSSKTLAIENKKIIKLNSSDNITAKVYEFMLKKNNIDDIDVESYTDNTIKIVFRNETYHEVIFDYENKTCTIYCGRCTRRQVIKSGFQHSTSKMLKNAVLVNPIVKSYIQFIAQ